MEKIRLGRTELMVTKTSFGALPIQRISETDAVKLVRRAYESGINYFDTANMYTDSEEKLGKALRDVRQDVVISTKSAATDKKTALAHIEESLRRLQTDYIDLFQFHNPAELPDPEDPDGSFAAALEMKEKGYGTWTNGFINAWFQTPDTAQFYVEKGKKIVVEPEQGANMDLISSMILSAGLCLILLQRTEPVMHGSAIEKDGKAIIVSGGSGAGKSTITMELLKQDVGFLADDTVRIHNENSMVVAEPTYPQQKICRDLAQEYGLELQKLRYIDEQRDKFALMRTERTRISGVRRKLTVK